MVESTIIFRRASGSKKKDKEVLQVDTKYVTMQNRRENALIISFKAPETESEDIYQFFDKFEELEPVMMDIEGTGDVEHYFRGISPITSTEDVGLPINQFSVTLQLRREFI
jgi:hypothetical protein